MMTNPSNGDELSLLLTQLVAGWENEVVEFKEAGDGFSTSKIGEYFSALSNEANLRGVTAGWLVFGVSNRTRTVVGTDYRPEHDRLQSLKMQIAADTEPGSSFREIHELADPLGRVLLMEVPAAPRGIPIAWKGHYYARAGESLTSLALDKLDEIRGQTTEDWSAVVVPDATLADLDPAALTRVREAFVKKYATRSPDTDIRDWPMDTLLDRARLTINGQLTRAALVLLGTPESAWRLSPNPVQITWNLIGQESAYEHFGPPFLLNTTALFQRIRNIRIRLLPEDQLLPEEVSKYDQQAVLEALHNCIAHQDYSRNSRIIVTEYPERLLFRNAGAFFEGHPDDYVQSTRVPLRYRNPFLVQAMVELNMIDTMGYGIRRMNNSQAKRYLPLPDYDLSHRDSVNLVIHGGVVDTAYTRLLLMNTDLPFTDILALDRIQKKLPIPDDAVRRLRQSKLIEGRRPHLHVAADVAAITASKAEYIRTRAQDDEHYAKMITDYLEKFTSATRKDIDSLIRDKLSEALTDRQKSTKISNLLTKMKRSGQLQNTGNRSHPRWELRR